MRWMPVHKFVALLLASNYFAFQVELFEEEYEANHPRGHTTASITKPTITWESFDKENAPKAFVFDANIRLEFLFLLQSPLVELSLPSPPYQPVRDKSPPPENVHNTVA